MTPPYSSNVSLNTCNRARTTAQHRVVRVSDIDPDAELSAYLGHQLLQQPGRCRPLQCDAHHCTSLPVNQPAASNVARASCTLRWPYVSTVVVIEAWPNSSFTLSIPAFLRSSQVA